MKRVFPLIFLLSLFFNFFFAYQYFNLKQKNLIKVIGVLDGDTIVLENKTRLRLRHIDGPEINLCGGAEAKQLLEKLVVNKKITIEENISDQKGRMMALVYVNNQLVNLIMLQSGWVRYHSDKTGQTEMLKKAANEAKNKKIGIYSTKCQQLKNEENPNCIIKGNIENNSGRKLYYLPNCAQYKFVVVEKDIGEQWFCTEDEAKKQGYEKAKTCY
jgi:endonuclease YncB( thermonuclease family)